MKKEMKTCPTCGREANVRVTNVQDGSEFCFACGPSSFDPRRILTMEDLKFMEQCGIDPALPDVLKTWVEAVKSRSLAELALTGNARKSKE